MTTTAPTPTATERPTAEELIARAEALVPVLRERAREAEQLRRIPDATMADLEAVGLFYVVSPRSEGGYGYGIRELGTITRTLAQGCASTAWVYSFLVVHNVSLTQDSRTCSRAGRSLARHCPPGSRPPPRAPRCRSTGAGGSAAGGRSPAAS